MGKRPLIIIAGPTAVGKSELGILLAKEIGGEIISADSIQIYKGLDIGSAKIKPDEMEGIPHYLIDQLDPKEPFHVARFQTMAKEAMERIYRHGNIPILVGGTGFYIQALLYDIDFTEEPEESDEYRNRLETRVLQGDTGALYEDLKAIDPLSAERIHPHNYQRIIRALDYYHHTGEPISVHNDRERRRRSPYDFHYFVLTDERAAIYSRIDRRVDKMIEAGLVEEVKQLKAMGCTMEMTSMQGIGYKELMAYLQGDYSLAEAIRILKRDTRHFAKRQLTWFKRESDAIWMYRDEFSQDTAKMTAYMKGKIDE